MSGSVLFNRIVLVFGIFCILYYLGMGFAITFRQSLLFLWPVMGCICLFRWAFVGHYLRLGEPLPIPSVLLWGYRAAVALALAVFLLGEYFICTGAREKAPDGLDCIIVLGARVNGTEPSGSLHERIEAAADYLTRNPDTLCIATGGRGDDESISEAECIRRELAARGISEERIVPEEASADTYENFRNSLPLLPDGTRSVGIVTNDFHIFRALILVRQQTELPCCGIPAKSSPAGFLHYALREFCALTVGLLNGELQPDAVRAACGL